jgi:hypothetical protein
MQIRCIQFLFITTGGRGRKGKEENVNIQEVDTFCLNYISIYSKKESSSPKFVIRINFRDLKQPFKAEEFQNEYHIYSICTFNFMGLISSSMISRLKKII